MATNNQLNLSLSTQTGTGKFVGDTAPTFVSPLSNSLRLSNTGILDNNGVTILTPQATASAVNYINAVNNIAGQNPYYEALGSDTDIILSLNGKGLGGVEIEGTHTNNNATAGYYGEEIESVVLASAPVTFVSGTRQNLTSISLTAGDWDVFADIGFSATTITIIQGAITTVNNTFPDSAYQVFMSDLGTATVCNLVVPSQRILLSTTTTVYLLSAAAGTGTILGYGYIWARRSR